jgi:hypothetical protein
MNIYFLNKILHLVVYFYTNIVQKWINKCKNKLEIFKEQTNF